MRCETYTLASETPVKPRELELDDYIRTQPPEIKDWLTRLDKFLLDNGCKREVKYEISYLYTAKKSKKRVCYIESEISGIIIQPSCYHSHATKSTPVVFPESILSALRNLHCAGCREACIFGGPFTFTQNGEEFAACRAVQEGYRLPLDNAEDREAIWKWIEAEANYSSQVAR